MVYEVTHLSETILKTLIYQIIRKQEIFYIHESNIDLFKSGLLYVY